MYFAQEGESMAQDGEHILADYLATVNGEDVGVILFQRGGRLSSLEVYSQAGTDSRLAFLSLRLSIHMKSFLSATGSTIVSRVESTVVKSRWHSLTRSWRWAAEGPTTLVRAIQSRQTGSRKVDKAGVDFAPLRVRQGAFRIPLISWFPVLTGVAHPR